MITIIDRKTGKEKVYTERLRIMKEVYSPMAIQYQLWGSDIIQEAVNYYKDVPLTPHEMTAVEKRKLKENPDYINDIPKWEVKGYDDFVTNERLDRRITAEFYGRFMVGDKKLIKLINEYHPTLRAK